MSCNHCTTKFNFFHKEMGCSNCGISFCNKCLKQKCKIPNKTPNEMYNVCKVCYRQLTTTNEPATTSTSNLMDISPPPDIFLKRLENLENPMAPPIIMYKQDPSIQALRTGLSLADQELVDRLERLKENDQKKSSPTPTESELRERLASLKGENYYVEGPSKKPFYISPDTRSDQEKSDDLLTQFLKERDIELAHNPQEKIEARLATLRKQGVRPNESLYISNLHDEGGSSEEGDEVDKLARKIMDEVALEEKTNYYSSKEETSKEDEEMEFDQDELPWCVLCNNNAKYRCLDCTGDLYCAECIAEVHSANTGDENHRVVPYKSK